ncbi:MAG: hypothetical protein RBT64_14840 [Trichloromonas sp.]|nr:hypothetical protein [Trichloromonas sp.]
MTKVLNIWMLFPCVNIYFVAINFKMKIIFYLPIITFLIISCSKEKIDFPSNAVSNSKDILSFKDPKEFFSVVDSLNKLPVNQAIGYKAEEGFLSLLTIRENYYECLEKATDQTMYDNIIIDHKDFLADGSIADFKIRSKVIYAVVNKDGIVQIGNQLYKFTEDGQIISNNNNIDQILSFTTNDKENDNIKIFKYSDFHATKTTYCESYHTTGLVYNGDRRCHLGSFIDIAVYGPYGDGTYYYKSYVWNEGIAEKKGLFGWKTYNTVNWLDLNYQVTLNTGFTKTTTQSLTNSSSYHISYVEYI